MNAAGKQEERFVMGGPVRSISLEKSNTSQGGAGSTPAEDRAGASSGPPGSGGGDAVACATRPVVSLRLDEIVRDSPRDRHGPDEELPAQAECIRTLGQTAPIVVCRAPGGALAPYVLVSGRRRLDAGFALAARHGPEHARVDAIVHDPMDPAVRIARQIAGVLPHQELFPSDGCRRPDIWSGSYGAGCVLSTVATGVPVGAGSFPAGREALTQRSAPPETRRAARQVVRPGPATLRWLLRGPTNAGRSGFASITGWRG